MQTFLIAVVTIVPVLGIMIVIHELGHHLVAKWFGVRVDTFSVGFGKRLFGFRMGETDYRVSAVPFGGYVKMAGENPMEQRTGASDEFMSHPRWQRIAIALAGPFMNILLAVVLLTGLFMVHHEFDPLADKPATIGNVDANSPASKAGLQTGDLIKKIDGLQNPTWEDAFNKVLLNSQSNISLTVLRNGQLVNLSLRPEQRAADELPYTGFLPEVPTTVISIDKGMPAEKAGMQIGDVITSLNGQAVHSIQSVQAYMKAHGTNPVTVGILRDGKELSMTLTPVPAIVDGKSSYRIGFGSGRIPQVDRLSFGDALNLSLATNGKTSMLVLEMVEKLIQKKVSLKQMDGPIGMARATGAAVQQQGWDTLIEIMALISVNLGIMNLLPIPILDGGLILLTVIESVIRRDINQRVKERIYQTAFVFLVLFAFTVVFNDVSKLPFFAKHLQ
jgi:regulator of sigma E protease